ncbi:MAG: hypothetical protein M3Y74_21885, partial [Chloroflexota bacterium]|nr:hypothetical protein [Chloroflexota bacterium]
GRLADELLDQGRADAAIAAALRALALARQIGDAANAGGTWETLGQVARAVSIPVTIEGVTYGAEECFAESVRVLREAGMEGPAARTLRTWAKDLWTQGERERAQALWREARDIFTRLGMAPELAGMADQPGGDSMTHGPIA